MSPTDTLRIRTRAKTEIGALEPLGYLVLAAIVALWAWRAFSDRNTYDAGAAYIGGQVAWSTGHPEGWFSWTGTPFLAVIMAIATRIMSAATMAKLIIAVNVALIVGTTAVVLARLRGTLARGWWWVLALGLVSFAPVMSTVWWKQFNMISLALALVGFELVRRDKQHVGGALIGISVAFKPLAILLPFVLLARRGTRAAGLWALIYLIALNLGAQWLMAAHAHSAGVLNPLLGVRNFVDKAEPRYDLTCNALNFAPESGICQVLGTGHLELQRALVLLVEVGLGAWIVATLKGSDARSWEVFAFTCAISTMVSPIAWSHYGVMLAPLLVLLLVRFTTDRADPWLWTGLAVGFVLASLIWSPYGTLTEALSGLSVSYHFTARTFTTEIAQFAQYVLIITGVLWYRRRGLDATSDAAVAPSPS